MAQREWEPQGLGVWAGLEEESGSLGGRLARALRGEEGPAARSKALTAVDSLFSGWHHPKVHCVAGQTWTTRPHLPALQPAWLVDEAVPALLAAAQTEEEGWHRVNAFWALHSALSLGHWAVPSATGHGHWAPGVIATLKAAWAADPAALARCLYQEPLDEALVTVCTKVVAKATVGAAWRLPEPGPVLAALAAFLRRLRLQGEGEELAWGWSGGLEQLLRGRQLFTREEVLSDEALSRQVAAAYLAHPPRPADGHGSDYRGPRRFCWALLGGVPAGDPRLDRFLRQGAAGACVKWLPRDLGSLDEDGLLPQQRLAGLLEAGAVGPETRALRAQLLRDAGFGELYPGLRGRFGAWPGVKEMEDRYVAALHLSVSRTTHLPFSITSHF